GVGARVDTPTTAAAGGAHCLAQHDLAAAVHMKFHGITGGELQRVAHSLRNGDVPPDCYSCCHAGVLRSAIPAVSHPCWSKCSPAARMATSGNTLRQELTIIAAEFELICPGCSRPRAPGTASLGGGGGNRTPVRKP